MSAVDRRAFAYALGRYVSGRTTMDLRAYASEAGMLADRLARAQRFERRMKTGRGSFARRLAAATGPESFRPATGTLGAASVVWGWDRWTSGNTPVPVTIAFYPYSTEYWTTE